MKVVVAEKPDQGRSYAGILGCTERHDGYLKGNGYAVTWAIGHIVSMQRPEGMGQKGLKLEDLPIIQDTPSYEVVESKERQFSVVESLLNDDDTDEVICATDAGREGEHIFRLIYEMAGCQKPISRLWVSSLTEKAIRKGFESLRPGAEFDDLAAAALCRAKADMHVGLNFSIAHSIHNAQKVATGRVMTPALALVVQRELDIKGFKTRFYFEIQATLEDGFKAKYIEGDSSQIEKKEIAQAIVEELAEQTTAKVVEKQTSDVKQKPPKLFNLLGLQAAANRALGLTAAQTLQIAQALYEQHKVISYPRTESCHLGSDMLDELPEILGGLPAFYDDCAQEGLKRFEGGQGLGKGYVDDAKLTDHHAIIPTGEAVNIDHLSMDERNVFLLVCERFVSIFLPECVSEKTQIKLSIGEREFCASGSAVKDLGWKKALITTSQKKEKDVLPVLEEGQTINVKKVALEKKQTKPLSRFNDASLLEAMKTSGKLVSDKDLADYMKENGIGTPATRANIIEKLISIGYLGRDKKNIIPTSKGMQRYEGELDELKSPKLTAQWEQKLCAIEDGEYSSEQFDQEIADFIKKMVPKVKDTPKIERETVGKCPVCEEGQIVEYGKAFGCSGYPSGDCKFAIWKNMLGKDITIAQAKQLLESGKTSVINGFTNSKGKKFNACLAVVNGDVKFVFEQIRCPVCKNGHVFETEKSFSCSEYKNGCQFTVWKKMLGKTMTLTHIKALSEKGRTSLISGFKSKAGKEFSAKLKVQGDKIELEFPKRKNRKSRQKQDQKNTRSGKR